jgi:hypothetical protein
VVLNRTGQNPHKQIYEVIGMENKKDNQPETMIAGIVALLFFVGIIHILTKVIF